MLLPRNKPAIPVHVSRDRLERTIVVSIPCGHIVKIDPSVEDRARAHLPTYRCNQAIESNLSGEIDLARMWQRWCREVAPVSACRYPR